MYVLKLALQKLATRPANTIFSVLLFAIGISIISLLILADKNLTKSVQRNFSEIDLVVGAKGSPLQLILSAVLHADYPTGNISLQEAENLARNPLVKTAIPLALGDNYRGYRIVGAPVEYPAIYNASLAKGHWYSLPLEAVVGANVAKNTGLQPGDQFYGVHGFQDAGHEHPEFSYTVKGILHPGAGITDNLILTPLASVWKVHGSHHQADAGQAEQEDSLHEEGEHDDHHHEDTPPSSAHQSDHEHNNEHSIDEHPDGQKISLHDQKELPANPLIASILEKIEAGEDISREEMELFQEYRQQTAILEEKDDREITAMLLQFRSPAGIIQFTRLVNESTKMQAAAPALEINRLMSLLSVGFDLLQVLAWIIIAISGINIFMHLWNTLRQGMHDIALMRVMGAARWKVFMMLLLQGTSIAVLGWISGIAMSRIIWLLLPSFHFMTEAGFAVLHLQELYLLFYAVLAGLLASLVPAWAAYNTDVHFTLTKK